MDEKLKLGKKDYSRLEGKELLAVMREKYAENPPPPQVSTADPYDMNLLEILGERRSLHQVQLFGQLKQYVKEFDLEKAAFSLLKLEKLGFVTVVNDFWKLAPKGRDFYDNL